MPSALSKLNHRGPDFQSYKIWTNVALGHTRLSILDLSANANQPFSDTAGRYHLVFNGEIYNYRELREDLQKEGIHFSTESDTEVLFQMLIHKGEAALQKLNGFFAFVFYDSEKEEILAARDRLGIKPLLYSVDDDKVVFSSELKAMLDFDISKKINPDTLTQYLTYTYVPAPGTILSAVKKMHPGELMVLNSAGVSLKKYYSLSDESKFDGDYSGAKKKLRELMEQSVELRLLADVPVGTFLSGGLDSSIVSMLASRQKKDLQTFSIGFDHPYFNESDYAQTVADHIGSRHEKIILSKKRFQDSLQPFLASIDEPFADSSAFAVYLLSEQARRSVTVCLSGDGADELFGGYRKHQAAAKMESYGSIQKRVIQLGAGLFKNSNETRSSSWGDFKRKLKKFSDGLDLSLEERYSRWIEWNEGISVNRLIKHHGSLFKWQDSLTSMNDFLIRDQQFVLPNDMLKKIDQMSMAHGLEVRVPFLDHNLVEFANSLPADWKVSSKKTKIILREIFQHDLPAIVTGRSKKGFEIPLLDWLQETFDQMMSASYFSDEYLADQGIFNEEIVHELRAKLKSKKIGEEIYLVWALVVFQSWYHQNIHPA